MTYAIEKFYNVPLWYFTEHDCQVADKDKTSNGDLWDFTKTSDNHLSLWTATFSRLSHNTWLIPANWPEGYINMLSFWQMENYEEKGIAEGKETLLLYQVSASKVWHDELKAGHFSNLAKLNEKKRTRTAKRFTPGTAP